MSSYPQPQGGGSVPVMSFPAPIVRANALSSLHPPPETPKRHSLTVSVSDISEVVDGSGRFLADSARETLINAARDGDEGLVKKLIETGTNVNAAEISGKTALQAAAESGHEGMVRILLNAGASLVTPAAEYSGRTALQAAAERGYGGIVKMLLGAGAKIDAPPTGDFGRTALQAAAGSGHMDVVRILLEAGANVNAPPSKSSGRTALQAAAEGGHEYVVQMLLKAEAYIDAYPSVFHGRTALQAAAGAGHRKIVEILIESGANIDAPPSEFSGRTALQAAAGEGREEIVSLLLKYQADINALPANSSGRTALQAAAESGHERIVKILIDAGASTDAPTSEFSGKTALQAAAGGGYEEIVRLILEAEISSGASKMESYGAEALEAAVSAGQLKIVKMLLDAGVNINTRNSMGRTCLFSPSMSSEMLQELVELGAYIDHADYDGMTPLHYAAENGCKELLISLLEAGATMDIEDNRTRRPLHLALEKKYEDLVKVMLGRGDNIRESRVKSWRAVLNAGETDIVMISEGASGANDIKKVDIDNVQIGIETEDLLLLKQFYNGHGRKWDDEKCQRLVDPCKFMSKYLALNTQPRHEPAIGADVKWLWALVNPRKDLHRPTRNFGYGIPNIGNIATTAHTKALLFCHVSFDFPVYIPPEKAELNEGETPQECCFHTEIHKTEISWAMRKTGSGDQEMYRSMNYRSTLDSGCVPKHGLDFFTLFIKDLHDKWMEVFRKAEKHLRESRKNLLVKGGKTANLIRTFLRDAQLWSDFRALYKQQVSQARELVKEFREKRLLYDEVNHSEGKPSVENVWSDDDSLSEGSSVYSSDSDSDYEKKKKAEKEKKKETDKKKKEMKKEKKMSKSKKDKIDIETKYLEGLIKSMKNKCKDNIKKLEKRTKEMIELEFNLVSIFEARMSTTTAQSMKRLTWITFVFLPLLFVASLFGMNLDILETGPVKWWWYVILSFSLFVMVLSSWAIFKYSSDVSKWCESLFMSLWNKLPSIPRPRRRVKSNPLDDLESGMKFKFT